MHWTTGVGGDVWLGFAHSRATPRPASPCTKPIGLLRGSRTGRVLRVGLLSRDYPPDAIAGGIATYTRDLAHGLHALGHEVHVFTRAATSLRREGTHLHVHGVAAEPVPVSWTLPSADRMLRWALAVAGRVRALREAGTVLDVIESPNWEVQGLALARLGLGPLVVRLHSPITTLLETNRWERSTDLAAVIALERSIIECADGVTSSTAAVLESVRQTMGVDPERDGRYARIPLGIRQASHGSPRPGPPQLLFVGRLERRKGIHTLLEIVPALLKDNPMLTVDIVGPDLERPSVREAFARRHAWASWRRRCRFHGQVDEDRLDELYARATVLVAPSLYESFGLIYLEAMRFGVPVVGCRAGGIPEVVRDGETGLLVEPDRPAELLGAIERLLGDPTLRAILGAAGRRAIETDFSVQRMAERTALFYAEVMDAAVGRERSSANPHG
jgi:glycogen synthase